MKSKKNENILDDVRLYVFSGTFAIALLVLSVITLAQPDTHLKIVLLEKTYGLIALTCWSIASLTEILRNKKWQKIATSTYQALVTSAVLFGGLHLLTYVQELGGLKALHLLPSPFGRNLMIEIFAFAALCIQAVSYLVLKRRHSTLLMYTSVLANAALLLLIGLSSQTNLLIAVILLCIYGALSITVIFWLAAPFLYQKLRQKPPALQVIITLGILVFTSIAIPIFLKINTPDEHNANHSQYNLIPGSNTHAH